jgi:GLPGLI family protein
MMKSTLIVLASLFLGAYVYPQNEVLKVEYDFYLSLGDLAQYRSTLLLSNDKSLFLWGKPIGEPKVDTEYEITIDLHAIDSIGSYTYTDKVLDSMFSRAPFLDKQAYLVKEKINPIAWKITDALKKIGPYNCQQAKALFRGRTYTVWFTYDIPISSGPWKLQGLPGLIINAKDDSGEVQFLLRSITKSDLEITPDLKTTKAISLSEYVEIQRSFSDKFYKKAKSRLPREIDIQITTQKSLEIFDSKD